MSNPFESPGSSDLAASPGRMRLRRVGVLSVAMFGGAAGVIMGLFAGGMMFLVSAVGVGFSGQAGANAPVAAVGMGLGMLIMAPLFYGVAGFIGGALNAFVYNVVAGMSGGIEMEFSPSDY